MWLHGRGISWWWRRCPGDGASHASGQLRAEAPEFHPRSGGFDDAEGIDWPEGDGEESHHQCMSDGPPEQEYDEHQVQAPALGSTQRLDNCSTDRPPPDQAERKAFVHEVPANQLTDAMLEKIQANEWQRTCRGTADPLEEETPELVEARMFTEEFTPGPSKGKEATWQDMRQCTRMLTMP